MTTPTSPLIMVNSTEWRNNYNDELTKVCDCLWTQTLAAANRIENEKGEKVKVSSGDLSNMMTQVAQAWRRKTQAAEQESSASAD